MSKPAEKVPGRPESTRALAPSPGALSTALRSAANSLIETVQIEAARDSRLSSLQSLYQDFNEGTGDYFQHIGLPKDATWEQFRAHYAVGDDDVDATRAFEDFAAYPPIAARIAELKAAGFADNSGKTGGSSLDGN